MHSGRRRLLIGAAHNASGPAMLGDLPVGSVFKLPSTAGDLYFAIAHKGAPSDATNFLGDPVYGNFSGGVVVIRTKPDKWTTASSEAMFGWSGSAMQTNLVNAYAEAFSADLYNQIMPVSIPCSPSSELTYQIPVANQRIWVPSAAEYGGTTSDGAVFAYFSGEDAPQRRAQGVGTGDSYATRSFYRKSVGGKTYYYYYTIDETGAIESSNGVNLSCPTVYARVCMVLPETYQAEVL